MHLHISDPMRVTAHDCIKLAGVQANSAKRIITSLSCNSKYDQKVLANMTDSLWTNRIKPVALIFKATLNGFQRGLKPGNQKQKHIRSSDNVFKNASHDVISFTLKVKITVRMWSPCCILWCRYDANEAMRDRSELLKQQHQH